MKTPMVYVNGRLYPEDQPHLSALDRGFTLGDGLFETMRAAGGRVFRWEDHLARLRRGAEVLAISLPGESALCDAVAAALEHRTGEPSLVRLTVTRGVDVGRGVAVRPGLTPTVVARAVPLVPPTTRGATAVVAPMRRNDTSPLSQVKAMGYGDSVLARRWAEQRGADEAVFLNTRGHVAGATTANIFAVVGDTLVTPPPESGALPGVTRRLVLDLARTAGIPVAERPLSLDDLASAREAFTTNIALGIRPLVSLDARPIGSGQPGEVTRLLSARLDDVWRRFVEGP